MPPQIASPRACRNAGQECESGSLSRELSLLTAIDLSMPLLRCVIGFVLAWTGFSNIPSGWAQEPQLETSFPLGMKLEQSTEFTLTGNDALKQATTLWSPQVDLDVERIEDKKAIRFRITPHPQETDPSSPFLLSGIDLYAVGPTGLGGPLRLQMADAQLVEILEDESSGRNDTPATAQKLPLNSVVNAVINPATDVDCFQVTLSAGQALRVRFQSLSLGNEVEPAITIFDPQGRELLHDDGSDLEPTLAFRAPMAGAYTIRVHERVWRKPVAAGYRLTVTDRPVVLAAFPPVLIADQEQEVKLIGYGLNDQFDTAAVVNKQSTAISEPLTSLTTRLSPPAIARVHDNQAAPASMAAFTVFDYQHPGTVGVVRLNRGDENTQVEDDSTNQHPETAPFITVPADIPGHFPEPRDQDWFRLQLAKDQKLWFDAYGERLGQLMDLQIDIHDAQGKLLNSLADTAAAKNRKDALAAATLDPVASWKAPAEGEYRFIIRDLYGTSVAGPTRIYRLFVTETPPVECVIAAHIVNLKPGGTAKLELYHHGSAVDQETITLQALDLPEGITAETLQLPTGGKPGVLILKAKENAPAWTGLLQLQAQRGDKPLPVRAIAPWRSGNTDSPRQTAGTVLHILGE